MYNSMMEMPEQEVPAIFSQMLQMFPNVPQDIILQYVHQFSNDVEKCVQMLNLQHVKYTRLHLTALENRKNLNECNDGELSPLIFVPETVGGNNNDIIFSNESEEQTEQTSYDSHSSYSTSLVSPNIAETNDIKNDFSRNSHATVNFNEPLMLEIVPDDEGISHSWRPSNSDDMLYPNIFVPPATISENFQSINHQISNWNLHQKHSELHLNPRAADIESGRYSMTAEIPQNYLLANWRDSTEDIANYLHHQKSQMNTIKYEVLKEKIEFSDVKESIERLEKELKEKMQSKSVKDIIDLNKEIEQLRLDCRCLCSEIDEVDDNTEHPILLGDVNERINLKNKSPVKNTDVQCIIATHSANSNEDPTADSHDESNKWQCHNCTFANHPAINVCEMCQLPKSGIRRPTFRPTPPSSCYCHPRESTLPVQS